MAIFLNNSKFDNLVILSAFVEDCQRIVVNINKQLNIKQLILKIQEFKFTENCATHNCFQYLKQENQSLLLKMHDARKNI